MPDTNLYIPNVNFANPSIGIVLAVYNGSAFLKQQLESISGQNHQAWCLYARDDGSDDGSQSMMENLSKTDPRMHLWLDGKGNLGAANNFASLMEIDELSTKQYLVFSDQDDVWVKDKLSIQLDAMRRLECEFPGSALLVHSDMSVVDAALGLIEPSFMHYQGIQHEVDPLPVLLTQNFVTGCTVLVNRRLLDIALPMPDSALMHDWWLALCAAVFGHIGYIDEPLVKYRQHGGNEVGAKHLGDFINPVSGEWVKRWREGRDNLFQSMRQAQALADRIRLHDPDNQNLALVEGYAALAGMSPCRRLKALRALGVHAQSNVRQGLLLSRLLCSSGAPHA